MVGPKRKEDRTLVVRLGPGDLAHSVLTHSRDTNGQRSTAELELKLGIIGEPFNSVSVDEITKSAIQEWLLDQSEERDWSPATQNRYHAAVSLVFRVSFENGKRNLLLRCGSRKAFYVVMCDFYRTTSARPRYWRLSEAQVVCVAI